MMYLTQPDRSGQKFNLVAEEENVSLHFTGFLIVDISLMLQTAYNS